MTTIKRVTDLVPGDVMWYSRYPNPGVDIHVIERVERKNPNGECVEIVFTDGLHQWYDHKCRVYVHPAGGEL